MNKEYTHISLLIDASSSMHGIKNAVISGVNEFLHQQKQIPGKATLSISQFATWSEKIMVGEPLLEAPELSDSNYIPNGGTALLDAFSDLIDETGKFLSDMKEEERPGNVVFVVFTDGEENSSRRVNLEVLKGKIQLQTEVYKWNFLFLGANIDAISAGAALGVKGVNFTSNASGMGVAMDYTTAYVGSSRLGNTAVLDLMDNVDSVDSAQARSIVDNFKKTLPKQDNEQK